MTRRPTPSELVWPDKPDDANLAVTWAASVTTQILDWIWRAFDSLQDDFLLHVEWTRSLEQVELEQIERDVVRNHFGKIQIIFAKETDGYASFYPSHEEPEMKSRSNAPAKTPAYDLAFVAISNPRWIWPVEAKIIRSPNALAKYLGDVNGKFLTGIAAPMVGEAAMIGYLFAADTDAVFTNLSGKLKQTLSPVDKFSGRPHRSSFHARETAPNLRLHHLLMQCVR